ncbi:MAG: tRNA (adenosine(37)-N6)-dimethylallyltransferase MiaA [Minisyncoccia bacterium]
MSNNKLIVIVGPTASGKSALAIGIARRFGGEIISADSRQIYKGLEIGSGKVTKKETLGVSHHLLGIISPKSTFTASQYQKIARLELKKMWDKGKLPILVGGTGFYIRAAVDGIVIPEVKPNIRLRKKLEDKSVLELSVILKKKDLRRWKEIDRRNPRRLIRSIEIAESLGKVPKLESNPLKADVLFIGITKNKSVLGKLIKRRVRKMIEKGLVGETQALIKKIPDRKIREFGFEYADTLDFLEGKIRTKKELIKKITGDSLKYAKRQMTWFEKDKRIHWVKNEREALRFIK